VTEARSIRGERARSSKQRM